VIAWVRRQLTREAGYSLVEMLTVMVIMTVVLAGITDIFVAGSKAQAEQDNRFQAQQTTRLALDKLRRDIHCASDVSPYATGSVTLKITACSGGDVSWCTVAVAGYTNRYRLYRQLGTSCGAASGVKLGDYVTSASVFTAFSHTTGCGCLASLAVDLPVSVRRSSTIEAYELTDTIYLRNSTRV
jgi:prepilin-type N-terminal cleavage/methylation domain-containing protein